MSFHNIFLKFYAKNLLPVEAEFEKFYARKSNKKFPTFNSLSDLFLSLENIPVVSGEYTNDITYGNGELFKL